MTARPDRYQSFCGIDCDIRAEQFMQDLHQKLADQCGDAKWRAYMALKIEQNQKMGQDALFFIGAQVNALYAYLETTEDKEALQHLWDIEQECC